MALNSDDKRHQLAMALGVTIQRFTQSVSMLIEDILYALCFTAGHALAQKAAKKFKAEKDLRELCITALDHGIREGNKVGDAPPLIMPNKNIILN